MSGITGLITKGLQSIIEVVQNTHDDLNANANIQVGNADVTGANPVPVTAATGGLTVTALRASVVEALTITAGAALSDEFDMSDYVAGDLYIPAAWTNANVGFYVATASGGTFVPAYDDNHNLIQSVVGAVTSQAIAFPPEAAGFRFVKLWSQLAGVNVLQGGDRAVNVELKS